MTIKDLFETLDYSSYDEIVIHWPNLNPDAEECEMHSEFSESIIDLVGHVKIHTMDECYDADGSDAALFIHHDKDDKIRIHIYLDREDVIDADT